MPNNFLIVGLCSRDWSRIESAEETDFDSLANANLCEIVGPKMPDELEYIAASHPPARYIHKETGEIHKGVNGPNENYDKYNRVELTAKESDSLKSKYGADNWFDWECANWGIKWGTYSTKVHKMGGDSSPILIEFQTAWGPPNSEMMSKITKHLCDKYRLSKIKWIGHDPADGSVGDLKLK